MRIEVTGAAGCLYIAKATNIPTLESWFYGTWQTTDCNMRDVGVILYPAHVARHRLPTTGSYVVYGPDNATHRGTSLQHARAVLYTEVMQVLRRIRASQDAPRWLALVPEIRVYTECYTWEKLQC